MANHNGNMMYSDDSSTLPKGEDLYSTSNETDEDLKEINSDESLCIDKTHDADNQMETNHAQKTKGSKQILENLEENIDKLTIKLSMEQTHISKKRNIDSVNDITPLNLVLQKKAKFGELFLPNHDQRDKTESLDHSGNKTSTMPIQVLHVNMDAASKYATTVSESNPNVRSIPITSTSTKSTGKITPSADISSTNNVIQKPNDETNEPITLADYILSEFGLLAPRKDTKCDFSDKNKESSEINSIDTTRDKNDDIEGQMKNSPRTNNFKSPTTSPGKIIKDKNMSSESVHAPSNNLLQQVLPVAQTSQQNTCVPSTQVYGEHFLKQIPTQILTCSSIETRDQHLSHISPIKVVASPNAGVPPRQTIHQQASGANKTQKDVNTFLSPEIKQLGPTAMLKFHLLSLKSLRSKITERVNKLEEKFRRVQAMIPDDEVKQISPSSLYPSESLPPWKSFDYVPSKIKEGGCWCAHCLQSIDFRQNCGNPLQANHGESKLNGYPDTTHINGQYQTQQIPMPRIYSTVLNSPPRSEQQRRAQMNVPMPGAYGQTGTYYRSPNNQLQNIPQAMGTTQGEPVIIARPQVSMNYIVERSGEITTRNLCPNVPLPVNKSNSHQIQLGQALDQIKCDPRSVDDIWKFFALVHKEKKKVAQFPPQLPSSQLQSQLPFTPSLHVPSRQTGYNETPRSVFDAKKMSETPLEFVQNKTNDTRSVPLDLSVKSHVNQF